MTEETRQGGCLCGQVRYTVPRQPLQTVICHCRHCQKQAGSAFSVVAVYPRQALQLDGELSTYQDKGSSGQKVFRRFCPKCGSPVLTDTERAREQGIIFIKAGTLDAIDDLQPSTHYWVGSKQPWLCLSDSDEQFERQ